METLSILSEVTVNMNWKKAMQKQELCNLISIVQYKSIFNKINESVFEHNTLRLQTKAV